MIDTEAQMSLPSEVTTWMHLGGKKNMTNGDAAYPSTHLPSEGITGPLSDGNVIPSFIKTNI